MKIELFDSASYERELKLLKEKNRKLMEKIEEITIKRRVLKIGA